MPPTSRLLKVAAWIVLGGIVFATLSPIGLRPETGEDPNLERAAAFALFGFIFALAYPRRLGLTIAVIVIAAVGLEALQMLAATRHARLPDVGFKLLGGGLGVAIGAILGRFIPTRR